MSEQPVSQSSYDFHGFGAPPSMPQMPEQRFFSTGTSPMGNPVSSFRCQPGEDNLRLAVWPARNSHDNSHSTSITSRLALTPVPLRFPSSSFCPSSLPIRPIPLPPPSFRPPQAPVLQLRQRPLPLALSSNKDSDVIAVSLSSENKWLWEKFYASETEMIITKTGRRMFPAIVITVKGLELDAMYRVVLEIPRTSTDRHRYRYTNFQWIKTSKSDIELGATSPPYWIHPDSPESGRFWMKNTVSFKKAKLTNDPRTARDHHVVLQSMKRYVPQINIKMETPANSGIYKSVFVETLQLCKFVAVTAYQSKTITQLKIDYNPFAKAFRASAGDSEIQGEAGPLPTPRYSVTTPSFATATSHPCNVMGLLPYATGYLPERAHSGHTPSYGPLPYYHIPIPQSPLQASASVSSTGCPYPPFPCMQQWRSIDPSRVGVAVASNSRASPPRYRGQSATILRSEASSVENTRIRQGREDPEDTSNEPAAVGNQES